MSNHITSATLRPDTYPVSDRYPFSLPIFHETKRIQFESPVTFFVGENGTGKSTLLEALTLASNVHIWRKPEVSYRANPYEKLLCNHIILEWANGWTPGSYFGSETFNDFRNVVDSWAAADPGQLKHFGGKSLVAQSHGQSMMSYFRSRYKIRGLYFLDEPETALSPTSQLALLDILRENAEAGHAQFIIATHSPILLTLEGAQIYSFDHSPVTEIGYKDTAYYKIYRRVLLGE
ncbi:MAG: AAA family ATPase [Planctomycetaceae bacterium]|nr:AAA family ATPase [Planctomycetaceae bacterium]